MVCGDVLVCGDGFVWCWCVVVVMGCWRCWCRCVYVALPLYVVERRTNFLYNDDDDD